MVDLLLAVNLSSEIIILSFYGKSLEEEITQMENVKCHSRCIAFLENIVTSCYMKI